MSSPATSTTAGARSAGVYVVASLLALAALAVPATVAGGDWGPLAAWGLTFVPGFFVLQLARRMQQANQATLFVAVSTGLRLAVAGIGGLLVALFATAVARNPFLFWLGAMYLLALALEVYLTLSLSSLQLIAKSFGSDPAANSTLQEAKR